MHKTKKMEYRLRSQSLEQYLNYDYQHDISIFYIGDGDIPSPEDFIRNINEKAQELISKESEHNIKEINYYLDEVMNEKSDFLAFTTKNKTTEEIIEQLHMLGVEVETPISEILMKVVENKNYSIHYIAVMEVIKQLDPNEWLIQDNPDDYASLLFLDNNAHPSRKGSKGYVNFERLWEVTR